MTTSHSWIDGETADKLRRLVPRRSEQAACGSVGSGKEEEEFLAVVESGLGDGMERVEEEDKITGVLSHEPERPNPQAIERMRLRLARVRARAQAKGLLVEETGGQGVVSGSEAESREESMELVAEISSGEEKGDQFASGEAGDRESGEGSALRSPVSGSLLAPELKEVSSLGKLVSGHVEEAIVLKWEEGVVFKRRCEALLAWVLAKGWFESAVVLDSQISILAGSEGNEGVDFRSLVVLLRVWQRLSGEDWDSRMVYTVHRDGGMYGLAAFPTPVGMVYICGCVGVRLESNALDVMEKAVLRVVGG